MDREGGLSKRAADACARGSRRRERLLATAALATLAVLAAGCADSTSWPQPTTEAPATITDRSRDATDTADFLRLLFVPSGVVPDRLGLPAALRVFATAAPFFEPALAAAVTADYPGLVYRADQDLVALRCSPPTDGGIDPVLASWPQTLKAIVADLGGSYSCPPAEGSPENEVYCIASEYVDTADTVVSATIGRALAVGMLLFETPERADVVRRRFGMYPAFSGLGFAVKGTGDGAAITAEAALRRSVVPEYLLRNATLADAGCYCLIVPPYDGRDAAPLDPAFVAQAGGFGSCKSVPRLERAGQATSASATT